MWPAAVDTHAGRTHGRAYTTSVRAHLKASPLWTSQLTALAQDAPVVEWGTSADGQALMTKRTRISSHNAEGYVMFLGPIIPTVKLEGSRYGGLTAIAHLRWPPGH
jgi:hypothetical protein